MSAPIRSVSPQTADSILTARSFSERAYDLEPLAQYLRAIGVSYESAGEPKSALAYYRQAYALHPRGSECAASLGAIGGVYFYYYREYAEAARDFQSSNSVRSQSRCFDLLAVGQQRTPAGPHEMRRLSLSRRRGTVGWQCLPCRMASRVRSLSCEAWAVAEAQQVYLSILQDAPDDSAAQSALTVRVYPETL